jgi:hypothetical protein
VHSQRVIVRPQTRFSRTAEAEATWDTTNPYGPIIMKLIFIFN